MNIPRIFTTIALLFLVVLSAGCTREEQKPAGVFDVGGLWPGMPLRQFNTIHPLRKCLADDVVKTTKYEYYREVCGIVDTPEIENIFRVGAEDVAPMLDVSISENPLGDGVDRVGTITISSLSGLEVRAFESKLGPPTESTQSEEIKNWIFGEYAYSTVFRKRENAYTVYLSWHK